MIFAWRTAFSHNPGKPGTILYFACLGLGYIMVEVGLIGRFTLALANPTVSATVLIAGMLVFSGLGSLVSTRIIDRARTVMPVIFLAHRRPPLRLRPPPRSAPRPDRRACLWLASGDLLRPDRAAGFLMGFPMAVGMTWLARLGKEGMFIWAWGINGCFSVVGAALVPIIATAFGLAAVLDVSAAAYLLAIPALIAVLLPRRPVAALAPA